MPSLLSGSTGATRFSAAWLCESQMQASMTPALQWIDWIGSALGLLGAYLLAFRMPASRYGWISFFAANLAYIVMAHQLGVMGLFAQQMGFLGSSAIGIYRHFIAKPVASPDAQFSHASWAISSRLAGLASLPPASRARQLTQLVDEARALHEAASASGACPAAALGQDPEAAVATQCEGSRA